MRQESRQSDNNQNMDLIRMNEVCILTTLKPATIWKAIRNGKMPRPIKMLGRLNCWHRQEIIDWIESMRITD